METSQIRAKDINKNVGHSGKRAESTQSNYRQDSETNLKPQRNGSAVSKKENKRSVSSIAFVEERQEVDNDYKCPNNTCISLCSETGNSPPLPTPRSIGTNRSTSESSSVPEFEYLQFSLRITEDIIRNDLYTNKEMQRVFNSHIEANRGRLSMKKMLEQINLLCKELNIGKNETTQNSKLLTQKNTKKKNKNHEKGDDISISISLENSEIVNQLLINKKLLTDDEIQKLNDNDLQDVINKLLNTHDSNDSYEKVEREEKIYSLDCGDLLRSPEMTVEEFLDDSEGNEGHKIIKHNLLASEIQNKEKFDFEKYIRLNFQRMGIDASVQTSLDDSKEKNGQDCMYNIYQNEKQKLMDGIFLEKNNQKQNDENYVTPKNSALNSKNCVSFAQICESLMNNCCDKSAIKNCSIWDRSKNWDNIKNINCAKNCENSSKNVTRPFDSFKNVSKTCDRSKNVSKICFSSNSCNGSKICDSSNSCNGSKSCDSSKNVSKICGSLENGSKICNSSGIDSKSCNSKKNASKICDSSKTCVFQENCSKIRDNLEIDSKSRNGSKTYDCSKIYDSSKTCIFQENYSEIPDNSEIDSKNCNGSKICDSSKTCVCQENCLKIPDNSDFDSKSCNGSKNTSKTYDCSKNASKMCDSSKTYFCQENCFKIPDNSDFDSKSCNGSKSALKTYDCSKNASKICDTSKTYVCQENCSKIPDSFEPDSKSCNSSKTCAYQGNRSKIPHYSENDSKSCNSSKTYDCSKTCVYQENCSKIPDNSEIDLKSRLSSKNASKTYNCSKNDSKICNNQENVLKSFESSKNNFDESKKLENNSKKGSKNIKILEKHNSSSKNVSKSYNSSNICDNSKNYSKSCDSSEKISKTDSECCSSSKKNSKTSDNSKIIDNSKNVSKSCNNSNIDDNSNSFEILPNDDLSPLQNAYDNKQIEILKPLTSDYFKSSLDNVTLNFSEDISDTFSIITEPLSSTEQIVTPKNKMIKSTSNLKTKKISIFTKPTENIDDQLLQKPFGNENLNQNKKNIAYDQKSPKKDEDAPKKTEILDFSKPDIKKSKNGPANNKNVLPYIKKFDKNQCANIDRNVSETPTNFNDSSEGCENIPLPLENDIDIIKNFEYHNFNPKNVTIVTKLSSDNVSNQTATFETKARLCETLECPNINQNVSETPKHFNDSSEGCKNIPLPFENDIDIIKSVESHNLNPKNVTIVTRLCSENVSNQTATFEEKARLCETLECPNINQNVSETSKNVNDSSEGCENIPLPFENDIDVIKNFDNHNFNPKNVTIVTRLSSENVSNQTATFEAKASLCETLEEFLATSIVTKSNKTVNNLTFVEPKPKFLEKTAKIDKNGNFELISDQNFDTSETRISESTMVQNKNFEVKILDVIGGDSNQNANFPRIENFNLDFESISENIEQPITSKNQVTDETSSCIQSPKITQSQSDFRYPSFLNLSSLPQESENNINYKYINYLSPIAEEDFNCYDSDYEKSVSTSRTSTNSKKSNQSNLSHKKLTPRHNTNQNASIKSEEIDSQIEISSPESFINQENLGEKSQNADKNTPTSISENDSETIMNPKLVENAIEISESSETSSIGSQNLSLGSCDDASEKVVTSENLGTKAKKEQNLSRNSSKSILMATEESKTSCQTTSSTILTSLSCESTISEKLVPSENFSDKSVTSIDSTEKSVENFDS